MISFGFKSGTGTASRVEDVAGRRITTGVLVQSNFGRREHLTIAGAPVGLEIDAPGVRDPDPAQAPGPHGDGSIVVVVATDAPLLPFQLRAVAARASLGLGRVGSVAAPSSGDLFLAFSTTNRSRYDATSERRFVSLPTESLEPLYAAVVDATEEAIVNALVAARPMEGVGGAFAPALPHDALRDALARFGR
jgi:L-aminopeptidase/D-esterase-like protein